MKGSSELEQSKIQNNFMKNLLLIFSVLLSTSLSALEYGHLKTHSLLEDCYIELGDGDLLTVIGGGHYNVFLFDTNVDVQLFVTDYSTVTNEDYIHYLGLLDSDNRPSIAGPAIVALPHQSTWDRRFLSYALIRKNEYQNSNVFSVIGDSSSTHNIVVETSTDLENWTPVHSSGLTGSSEQIYVRTRISTSE